jgi:hypothetical protein
MLFKKLLHYIHIHLILKTAFKLGFDLQIFVNNTKKICGASLQVDFILTMGSTRSKEKTS